MMHKGHNPMELLIIILLVIVVAILLYFHFGGKQVVHVSDESLILVFVGIMATFIVVGNAQQVREIRNDMHTELRERREEENDKIASLKQEIDTKFQSCDQLHKDFSKRVDDGFNNTELKIQTIEEKLKKNQVRLHANETKISEFESTTDAKIDQQQKTNVELLNMIISNNHCIQELQRDASDVSVNIKELLYGILLLNDDDTSKLLIELFYKEKPFYNVECGSDQRTQAIMQKGPELQFVDANTNELIDNISKIENLSYDSARISKIYLSLMNLNRVSGEVLAKKVNDDSQNSVL